ncbi:Mitochondrial tRNA-specific 2-thiouridylase 1 [Wickerhamiella sorbophila]|uniref:tRNA-5-taurinomethyluridine 2-sulfurtransferase n=1 Tax=Wickerhamiella sorbophila TaxID=45607 RepID=A0A2T0FFD8_9ASCO|nr:Mitochondrial tRNA-specific 2-thiouridylase 1 [Wickerhamiella sorbophila]PRT53712.1 Mitochondrial tRNA-specific 2-thiouridylase 1 [Wickerhamiella sorbophila]
MRFSRILRQNVAKSIIIDRTGLKKVGRNDIIYVAMSSGVDSSTVANILGQRFGKSRVRGVFMNNWSEDSRCMESEWREAQAAADHAGIECHRVDLERDYWAEVFEPMLESYRKGATPNPDVSCNKHVKFGALIDHLRARDPNFKWIATGHYAGVDRGLICRPLDLKKDQSYYLSTVPPSVVNHALFPLAELRKPEVRQIAADLGVPTAQKPDSQGLCFVEQNAKSFDAFLAEYLVPTKGLIKTVDGLVVGTHNGLWTATIGQRVGLPMPQSLPETRGKWFVCAKNIEENTLIICPGRDNPLLYHDTIQTKNFEWHVPAWDSPNLFAQYRSLMIPVACTATSSGRVIFREPRRAVAPGQFLVIYENDRIVGSGEITHATKSP